MVDFPDPEGPTMATHSPARRSKERFWKIGTSGRVGYAKLTLEKLTFPVIGYRSSPAVSVVVWLSLYRRSKSDAAIFAFDNWGTAISDLLT